MIFPKKLLKSKITVENIKEMEVKLRNFILTDTDFFNISKKYSINYREFMPVNDGCIVQWNKKDKSWDFLGYKRLNVNEELPNKPKNTLFLDLKLKGYSWGDLFYEMELRFNETLAEAMNEEELTELMENNYNEYALKRRDYFSKNKDDILNDWFSIDEEAQQEYIEKILNDFRETTLNQKRMTY